MASGLTIMDRLMAAVEYDTNGGCWLWGKAVTQAGYGVIRIDHRNHYAHRLSWTLHKGPIGGLHVLHRCDTPACCNPAHLFLGTPSDNMTDMWAKGRGNKQRGEARAAAKLTEAAVRAIRASHEGPLALAKRYGVVDRTINDVRARKTWRHI